MTNAIKNRLNVSDSKAKTIAVFVMDTFGFELRIIDNILKPDERQLFYMLEAEGFLSTGRERSRLHDGREWMTHYWQLQCSQIHHFATHKKKVVIPETVKKSSPQPQTSTVYNSLSDDLWMSRKILNHNL